MTPVEPSYDCETFSEELGMSSDMGLGPAKNTVVVDDDLKALVALPSSK